VARQTHSEREELIIADLRKHFPAFAGGLAWTKVPDGQDPPDFRSGGSGLELVEWLDGSQMTAAKGRESQREQLHRILATDWQREYQPRSFRGAFVRPGSLRVAANEEAVLRAQFFALAKQVDETWQTNPDRVGNSYNPHPQDLGDYALVIKYCSVRFIGGQPHGLCWIGLSGDGGAYDPQEAVSTLTKGLDGKLAAYSLPERQEHFRAQDLNQLLLLVHGGFNAFAYNTPSLSLEEVANRGATFYAEHPLRHVFHSVWFFNSLDSADNVNVLLGIAPGVGRERRLWQLWPKLEAVTERR
jgi:hypothetical protein